MKPRHERPVLSYGVDPKAKRTTAADVWWSLLGAYGVWVVAIAATAILFWLGF